MQKYAVIRIKGRQYKVEEGEELLVDKLLDKKAAPEVLLIVDGKKVTLGKPVIKDAKVKIKILEEEKGKKIQVQKYKAKSRYRKKIGFRPIYTKLLIQSIN